MTDITKTANKLMEFGCKPDEALRLAKKIKQNLDEYSRNESIMAEIERVVNRVRVRN